MSRSEVLHAAVCHAPLTALRAWPRTKASHSAVACTGFARPPGPPLRRPCRWHTKFGPQRRLSAGGLPHAAGSALAALHPGPHAYDPASEATSRAAAGRACATQHPSPPPRAQTLSTSREDATYFLCGYLRATGGGARAAHPAERRSGGAEEGLKVSCRPDAGPGDERKYCRLEPACSSTAAARSCQPRRRRRSRPRRALVRLASQAGMVAAPLRPPGGATRLAQTRAPRLAPAPTPSFWHTRGLLQHGQPVVLPRVEAPKQHTADVAIIGSGIAGYVRLLPSATGTGHAGVSAQGGLAPAAACCYACANLFGLAPLVWLMSFWCWRCVMNSASAAAHHAPQDQPGVPSVSSRPRCDGCARRRPPHCWRRDGPERRTAVALVSTRHDKVS
eukprot:365318-Chlamydomonas_euryale.AAC.15